MIQLRMKLPSWYPVVAVLSVTVFAEESIDVSYEELKALKASCFPYDACTGERGDENVERNCECGPECAVYGTCCVDSPYRDMNRTAESTRPLTEVCTKVFGSRKSYFMVKECDPSWNGSVEVKTLCEQDIQDPRDPFVFIPASSIERKKTYKNFFCGLCNNVDPNELRTWNVTLELERVVQEDADALFKKLTYDESGKKWGLLVEGYIGRPYFQKVDLIPEAPEYLAEVSGLCIPDLVSICNASWEDETVRRKCDSYLAAIFVNPERRGLGMLRYRNVHCALCNYKTLQPGIKCKSLIRRSWGMKFTDLLDVYPGWGMKFTVLLDVNPYDGGKVGKVDRCGAGQSYDPFFKKCRTLECGLRGFVIEKKKCVKST